MCGMDVCAEYKLGRGHVSSEIVCILQSVHTKTTVLIVLLQISPCNGKLLNCGIHWLEMDKKEASLKVRPCGSNWDLDLWNYGQIKCICWFSLPHSKFKLPLHYSPPR